MEQLSGIFSFLTSPTATGGNGMSDVVLPIVGAVMALIAFAVLCFSRAKPAAAKIPEVVPAAKRSQP